MGGIKMLTKITIKNQLILMFALVSVVFIALVAGLIGNYLAFSISYGLLAIMTWALSKYFKKENVFTTSLKYFFLVLSSTCLASFILF